MEALGLDIKLLIAQIVNFAIFYFIFQKFVAKPLLGNIKKQKEDEKKRGDLTISLETAKKHIEHDRKNMIAEMTQKQSELIEQSRQYAENLKSDLLAKAQKQADELVANGKSVIDLERRKALEEVKSYVKDYAQKILLKSLSNNLDVTTKSKITQSILEDIT